MKNVVYIWRLVPVLAALFMSSCVKETMVDDAITASLTRGVISVEVVTPGADMDDQIRKVRFLVFDNASVYPKLDVNEVISFGVPYRYAKSFRTTLEVNQNDDKMVMVVINEQNEHKTALDAVIFPADLEKLMYDGRVTGNDPMALNVPPVTGLPMSGVKRGIAVTAANATIETAAQVSMTVERSLARVEVWMRAEPGVTVRTRAGTSPTQAHLYRSDSVGYLVAGTEADGTRFQTGAAAENNFGLMLDVADPKQHFLWSCFPYEAREIGTTAEMLVAFYIPERMCDAPGDANKLTLDILNVETPTGDRKVEDIVLSEFIPEGGTRPEPLTMIRRNNIYRITAVVETEKIEFDHEIVPWNEKTVGVIADPQYFLRVSQDQLGFYGNAGTATITAETDYDKDEPERGFKKGISLGQVSYYDANGTGMADFDGDLYGWLDVSLSGSEGDLSRTVTFTLTKNYSPGKAGYYAIVGIRAGNLTKNIKVTRFPAHS